MDENKELDDNMDFQGDANSSSNEPPAFSNPDEVQSSDKILTDLADFDDLDETQFGADVVSESFEFLQDLEMNVYIELGRTKNANKRCSWTRAWICNWVEQISKRTRGYFLLTTKKLLKVKWLL